MRLIHDCSLPAGQAVNDYCSIEWHQRFSRVDDAAALVTEGCFMAKVDLQSAYRHVKLSDHSKKVTELKCQFGNKTVYLRDTCLCFGSKLAPGIFHRLTQAVRRMLVRRMLVRHGLAATVVYLDDFFIFPSRFLDWRSFLIAPFPDLCLLVPFYNVNIMYICFVCICVNDYCLLVLFYQPSLELVIKHLYYCDCDNTYISKNFYQRKLILLNLSYT